jgi:hypothetical protein
MFTKQGQIINTFAQCPVVDKLEDRWRIYYAMRLNGRSHPQYIDVEPGNPNKIIDQSFEDVLSIVGTDGILPTFIMTHDGKKYFYYIEWHNQPDGTYVNRTCLAINGVKQGPILPLDDGDIFTGTIWIYKGRKGFIGVYLSCYDRIKDGDPIYNFRYAVSKDGIHWMKSDTRVHREGHSLCSYTKCKDIAMWCERSNGLRNYRITGEREGIQPSKTGWDSEMTAYPYMIEHEGKIFLFYNGNGFGATGIGYATL